MVPASNLRQWPLLLHISMALENPCAGSSPVPAALKGPGRVVITATRTAFERNESKFAEQFVRGLSSNEADADKDGRTTVMESFTFAVREVAKACDRAGKHNLQLNRHRNDTSHQTCPSPWTPPCPTIILFSFDAV